jgi:non-ribosomal peptide synthetase component F
LPFEQLVEALHPERSLSHTPLFQVLFNMTHLEDRHPEFPGLTVNSQPLSVCESKFDLTLYVRDRDGQIELSAVYRAELFDDARMRALLQQYRRLLEQIVADPAKPVAIYSLLTPDSRTMIPDPATMLPEPQQRTVTEDFFEWAAKHPAFPAIRQGERIWSYRELAASAHALAEALVAAGSAPGAVLALHGHASFGMIAAMIAVLLTGGVLLALDPALPERRKQRMLREAGAKKVIHSCGPEEIGRRVAGRVR